VVEARAPLALLLAAALAAGCSGATAETGDGPGAPALAGPAAAPAGARTVAFAERASELGIENAARVAEGVYRGAQPDGEGLRRLKEKGFRTVINLRSAHSERKECEALGLDAVEIPLNAFLTSTPPTDGEVARFFEVVLDPARRPVYFHCAFGKDRTGTMAALYRIEVDGWSNEDALAEMRHFGYHEYYRDLETFLRGYRSRGHGAPGPR
jgi:protein tyrosine phosphatase (PTP) superfamily phosphohydrolase (DUF442 family)